jgi:hypothetical protein
MIRFACYQCGQVFRARDDHAGKAGKCKRCGVPLQIPVFIQGNGTPPGPPPGPTAAPPQAVNPLGFLNMPSAASPSLRPRPSRRRIGSGLGLPIGVGLAVGGLLILLMFAFAEPLRAVAPAIAPKNPFAAPAVRIEPPKDAEGGMSFEPPEWIASLLQLVVTLGIVSTPITVPVALSRAGCLSLGRWLCMAAFCGLACFGSGYAVDAMAGVQPYGVALAPPAIQTALSFLTFVAMLSFVCGMGCVLAAALHPKPKAG